MVAYGSIDPVNIDSLVTDTYDGAGYLVKYSASGLLKTAAVTDTPIGVTIDESSRDADGSLVAVADATVSILPLSGIIYVKCMAIAAASVKQGMSLYTSQTADADGHVDDSSANSAVLVGYYMGKGGIDISTGDLVPVAVA
jgi:hypothetical protein